MTLNVALIWFANVDATSPLGYSDIKSK